MNAAVHTAGRRLPNPVLGGYCRFDEIAAKCSETREHPILIRASEPAVADHIGDQDCRKLGLAHRAHLGSQISPNASTSLSARRKDR